MRSALPIGFEEKTYAGVLGKIIGVYLGRPFEQRSYEWIQANLGDVEYYVHDKLGQPLIVTDDDITGTFTFVRALKAYGPKVTPSQIGDWWMNTIIESKAILWWGGMGTSTEHTAYLRMKSGIPAPLSGSIELNGATVAEQIGAQIFIDGWAMVAPGQPDLAADFAIRAGSVSHDGAALHGAQVIAVMESLAYVESDINILLDRALEYIPADCVIRRLIDDVRDWHRAGIDWREGREKIQEKYGYEVYGGGCHMVPNHALIIHALLHGEGDFDRSMMIVNSCGYDTDCNSGNLGCLLGIRGGLAGLQQNRDWRGPVADRLLLPTADGGNCISDAVREAQRIIRLAHRVAGEPIPERLPRFNFQFAGSVQGFGTEAGEPVDTMPGAICAKIGKTLTPSFVLPEQLQLGGYSVLASPIVHAGQTLSAEINGAGKFRLVAQLADTLEFLAGEWQATEWTIPSLAGHVISQLGLEVEEGEVWLRSLDIRGCPQTPLMPAQGAKIAQAAWVNGLSELHFWGEEITAIKNRGTGLAIQGNETWKDISFVATVRANLAKRVGITVATSGLTHWVGLVLCANGAIQIVASKDKEAVVWESEFEFQLYRNYEMKIETRGTAMRAWIDGSELHCLDLGFPLSGAVGLLVEEGRVWFANPKVEPTV